jgi:uncharacterized protein YkwD
MNFSDNYSGPVRTRTVSNAISKPELERTAITVEQRVFEILNSQRAANGLEPLVWSDEVAVVARLHSENMAAEKFFSHRGSDGSMVNDRAFRKGLFNWTAIGENIAFLRGFPNPEQKAVENWMNSPAHKKNLLSSNWTESAVGVAITADGTYYLTQVFIKD